MKTYDAKIGEYWLTSVFVIVIFILAVFFAIYIGGLSKRNPSSFTLIDQNGAVYDSSDHKIFKLVFFGFTHCPHICPTGLATMDGALDMISTGKDVQPVFITIDPERDKPKVIKNYLESFSANFIGLTGAAEELGGVKNKFQIYAKKLYPAGGDEYTMDHSTHLYLLDKNDIMIDTFDYRANPSKLASAIETYMNQ